MGWAPEALGLWAHCVTHEDDKEGLPALEWEAATSMQGPLFPMYPLRSLEWDMLATQEEAVKGLFPVCLK